MLTESYNYVLPEELIAHEPVSPRDTCRLMVLDRSKGSIRHHSFRDLVDLLVPGDVLVFNDSRVIPARLLLEYRGRMVEVFLTKRLDGTDWLALVRPGRLLKPGVELVLDKNLSLEILAVRDDGQRRVRFSKSGALQEKVLRKVGQAPYPPYIRNTKATFDDYQTVYAEPEGSVAAPTAGLHFTRDLLQKLGSKGVQQEFVTLHVGLGTFLPIKTDTIEDHVMHHESYVLDEATAGRLNDAKREGRRIIAVGTTAVRVLEDSFDIENGFQWGERETNMYIYPGYEWKCVDALITNFHLPKSSLLLLVAALAGKDFIFRAYEEAIAQRYRFYSFGDAMFIV